MNVALKTEQIERMRYGKGFIAALDQSGGSTPKALKLYGIEESAFNTEAEMFDLVHQMRTRIITSPVFTSERILGVILFEMTMDRVIEGIGSAEYLWQKKGIVPFLKIDNGLMDEDHGSQLMKPIPQLSARLASANVHGVFGTKMRSVIKEPNEVGIQGCVAQQFEFAREILAQGLVPIIEPEVDIHSPDKLACEIELRDSLMHHLDQLHDEDNVMLKLTLPEQENFYTSILDHPRVLRVVALSGGYHRERANELLKLNLGLIASFSRALTEGLSVGQSATEFDSALDASIQTIFEASIK